MIAPLPLLLGMTLVVGPVVVPARTSTLPAGVQGTGPTGRGRLVVIAPIDPLGDPAWRLRGRRLRIATGTSAGLLGASIASIAVWAPLAGGINDDPGPRPGPGPVFPWIALGTGAASLLATVAIGRLYDVHLRSASRYVGASDLRIEPAWVKREQTLSRRLYLSAAFTGVGFAAGPLLFAQNEEDQVPGLLVTSIGLGALIALAVVAVQLRHHRRRIVHWPRRGASSR